MPKVIVNPCPCCKQPLLRLLVAGIGAPENMSGNPEMKVEKGQPYMECPHCQKRVLFSVVGTNGGVTEYSLSPNQPCG